MSMINDYTIHKWIDLQLKDIVTSNFKTAEIFEKYNIDFCCNGKRTLRDALKENGIDQNIIIEELEKVNTQNDSTKENYSEWNLIDLINHIVDTHHSYVRNTIPTIKSHLEIITSKHGTNHPFLHDVKSLFNDLSEEMVAHMMKEEQILFPLIKYIVETERYNEKPKTRGYGSVQNPIRQMEVEHDRAGNIMHKIRQLTNEYDLPTDACTTFALTYDELKEFEKDLHKHVHLENNILFPKTIELESSMLVRK